MEYIGYNEVKCFRNQKRNNIKIILNDVLIKNIYVDAFLA